MWILVHDPNTGKAFLSNPETGVFIMENDGWRTLYRRENGDTYLSPLTSYRESLSELAVLLGAVGMGECPVCKGTGKIDNWVTTDKFCPDKVETPCPHCSGTGHGRGPVKEVK